MGNSDQTDECLPSILLKYNSDNDSRDVVFPADAEMVRDHWERQKDREDSEGMTSSSSSTPLPDLTEVERTPTPSPTKDSPMTVRKDQTKHLEDVDTDHRKQFRDRKLLIPPDDDDEGGCSCHWWISGLKRKISAFGKTLWNLNRSLMEWALMYSGRPSSSANHVSEGPSVAERERQQAEDFVNGNLDTPLEVLAEQNREFQRLKVKEYQEKRSKKSPCLEDQPRGEDGRIIFSQEYIDFMLYRDLQPLVDLRILQHTETVIKRKISERDAAKKLAEELESKVQISEEKPADEDAKSPSTSQNSTA